jgi:hypothetical protein
MTDDSAGTDQRGGRLPYVKPFVRNLDVMDTEGKTHAPGETLTFFDGISFGPS